MTPTFRVAATELLAKSGGALTYAEACARWSCSIDQLHSRLREAGFLAVELDGEFFLPAVQFEDPNSGVVVHGVTDVLELFLLAGDGGWGALQFLQEHDPNLNGVPISALREGRRIEVAHAARAHLDLPPLPVGDHSEGGANRGPWLGRHLTADEDAELGRRSLREHGGHSPNEMRKFIRSLPGYVPKPTDDNG